MNARDQQAANKFDAVLPLALRDFERFRILHASLSRASEDMGTCWIVTPDQEYPALAAKVSGKNYRVVPESRIVPEFRSFPSVEGWYKQQMIKIAIAAEIKTEFYLTLDADLFCTRPLRYSDLVQDGRAPCFVGQHGKYPEWYGWAERVLKLPWPGEFHNVTPAVLSRAAMLKMQRHLSELAGNREGISENERRSSKLGFSAQRLWNGWFSNARQQRPWAVYLLGNLPWTEYSLYYTFLEATGQFEKYHVRSESCLYSKDRCLWTTDQVDTWDPWTKAGEDDPAFFLVIQSNTGIDPRLVWQKLQPLLPKKNETLTRTRHQAFCDKFRRPC